MIIDCDSCEVRGVACGDCVVTALLGAPPAGVDLDEGERAAIDALAGSGLVPPLRLMLAVDDSRVRGRASAVEGGVPDVPDVANEQISRSLQRPDDGRSVAAG